MTGQGVKDNAPEGATHYEMDRGNVYYYEVKCGKIVCRIKIPCGCRDYAIDWSYQQAYDYNQNMLKPL